MKVHSEEEIEREWSCDDLLMGHDVLDALDAAEAEGRRRAKAAAEAR